MEKTSRFLRIEEVSRITGLTKGGLYKLIRQGRFPAPIKITTRSSGWADDHIVNWVDTKKEGRPWNETGGQS
jgi:prophage regulatory protein